MAQKQILQLQQLQYTNLENSDSGKRQPETKIVQLQIVIIK